MLKACAKIAAVLVVLLAIAQISPGEGCPGIANAYAQAAAKYQAAGCAQNAAICAQMENWYSSSANCYGNQPMATPPTISLGPCPSSGSNGDSGAGSPSINSTTPQNAQGQNVQTAVNLVGGLLNLYQQHQEQEDQQQQQQLEQQQEQQQNQEQQQSQDQQKSRDLDNFMDDSGLSSSSSNQSGSSDSVDALVNSDNDSFAAQAESPSESNSNSSSPPTSESDAESPPTDMGEFAGKNVDTLKADVEDSDAQELYNDLDYQTKNEIVTGDRSTGTQDYGQNADKAIEQTPVGGMVSPGDLGGLTDQPVPALASGFSGGAQQELDETMVGQVQQQTSGAGGVSQDPPDLSGEPETELTQADEEDSPVEQSRYQAIADAYQSAKGSLTTMANRLFGSGDSDQGGAAGGSAPNERNNSSTDDAVTDLCRYLGDARRSTTMADLMLPLDFMAESIRRSLRQAAGLPAGLLNGGITPDD